MVLELIEPADSALAPSLWVVTYLTLSSHPCVSACLRCRWLQCLPRADWRFSMVSGKIREA